MGRELKNILLLSSGDTYGAYELLYRMAKALKKDGHNVVLLVTDQKKNDDFIQKIVIHTKPKSYIKRFINLIKRKLGKKAKELLTDPKYVFLDGENESHSLVNAEKILEKTPFVPNIVISGMTNNFLGTNTLAEIQHKTSAKIHQVMVDMHTITGGCHVVWDCDGFVNKCEKCPALLGKNFDYFAKNNLDIKSRNINNHNFSLLVSQGWTLFQANRSFLFKEREKTIIGSCIDVEVFNNRNRDVAKKILNLPLNTKLIFAGSNNVNDPRKGKKYLVDALNELWLHLKENEREDVCVLLAGNHNSEDNLTSAIKFKKQFIDFVSDYRLLSIVYQASDIYVCPSLEDGGPMMVSESLACGTPVVGFEVGLLFDDSIIKNGYNGYRVKLKDVEGLAFGIAEILKLQNSEFLKISNNAREVAVNFLSESYFVKSIIK
jgi:glycosyltransferase involved in cell wall biosynthesis